MGLKLKRNSWHRKLQQYVLGLSTSRYEDMHNLCPYFWLTIFCLIVVPFVSLFRGVRNVCVKTADLIDRMIAPLVDRWYANLDIDQIAYLAYWKEGDFRKWWENSNNAVNNRGYYNELQRYTDMYRKRKQADDDRKHLAQQRRRALANKISYYTSKLVPPALIVLGAIVCYVVYLLGSLLYDVFTWDSFLAFLKVLGIATSIVIAVLTIGYTFARLSKKSANVICAIGRKINPFGWLGEVFSFIGLYMKSTKDNYCPHVEWEE